MRPALMLVVLLVFLALIGGPDDPVFAQHEHADAVVCASPDNPAMRDQINAALRRVRQLTALLAESESKRTGELVAKIKERIEKDNP